MVGHTAAMPGPVPGGLLLIPNHHSSHPLETQGHSITAGTPCTSGALCISRKHNSCQALHPTRCHSTASSSSCQPPSRSHSTCCVTVQTLAALETHTPGTAMWHHTSQLQLAETPNRPSPATSLHSTHPWTRRQLAARSDHSDRAPALPSGGAVKTNLPSQEPARLPQHTAHSQGITHMSQDPHARLCEIT